MNTDYEFLKEQYIQANEHLRENDRKRDAALGLYVTLTLAYYGFFEKKIQDPSMSIYFIVGLTLFGICLGILFTLYRGWHGLYVLMGIIIQQKIHNHQIEINKSFVKKIDFKFNIFTSVELFMYIILNIIILLNALKSYTLLSLTKHNIYAILLLVIVIIQFIFHFIAMYRLDYLKNNEKLSTKYLWLLQKTFLELDN